MTDKVLILGYGRAGKRHAKLAAEFGLDVYLYDPLNPRKPYIDGFHNCLFRDYSELAVQASDFDYVVICTPPDQHLRQIEDCVFLGMKSILCEKPLCAIGQLERARRMPATSPVMVAYNYRYHPKLRAIAGQIEKFTMHCEQQRADLPEWGLLLDHCSHDLDILRMVTGHDLRVQAAKGSVDTTSYQTITYWFIKTCLGDIMEMVTNQPVERQAVIRPQDGAEIEIDPDPQMFTDMWQAFLTGDYEGSLAEAIKTQALLEDCYRLNEVNSDC